jgi:hypothetical protein
VNLEERLSALVRGLWRQKWAAGVAAGVGAAWLLYLFGFFDGKPSDAGGDVAPPSDTPGFGDAELGAFPVAHRSRADGVHPDLLAFLDAWETSGPFRLVVCPDGGIRADEAKQAAIYAAGNSKAATLAATPHGRGGALDVAPYYRGVDLLYAPQYDATRDAFAAIGAFAKARGLAWGGDWGWDFGHIEVRQWASLPFPPEGFA